MADPSNIYYRKSVTGGRHACWRWVRDRTKRCIERGTIRRNDRAGRSARALLAGNPQPRARLAPPCRCGPCCARRGPASRTAPGEVAFEAGSATAGLEIATVDDEAAETASTVTAALTASEGYTVDAESGSAEVAVEDDDAAPVVTTALPLEDAEGATAVATHAATDDDTPVGELAWSIPEGADGGADAAAFEVTADGALTFRTAKDFESPDDTDADGEYAVTVRVA